MINNDAAEMNFLDHLGELRRRLIVCVIAVFLVSAASFAFAEAILGILLAPSGGLRLKGFNLMDGFAIKLNIALFCGLCLTFPLVVFQLLAFAGPALSPAARKRIVPFVAASTLLLIAGIAFGYALLGTMIKVLTQLYPPQIEYLPSASAYVSFVGFFLLACGIAFQLPCVIILLASLRVVSARSLRKGRRVAWFILFAFAEIVTPVSDPIVAPLVVMLPLVLLFEASIFVTGRIEARKA